LRRIARQQAECKRAIDQFTNYALHAGADPVHVMLSFFARLVGNRPLQWLDPSIVFQGCAKVGVTPNERLQRLV
jgi:hypothetical protein